jgi:hypothetical protein
MASETQHCGQKQIRCAEDFWRGRTPNSLREKIDGNRFLSGLELAIATKAE